MSSKKLNINLEDCQDVCCANCDGKYFSAIFSLKKVSSLVSPTGDDMFLPVQMFQCQECSHINEEFVK